jgi:hypothetical protein
MYAQNDTIAPSSSPPAVRPTTNRANLRTRPRSQRILIRSWDYIKPVRVTILAIRVLVTLWLIYLAGVLVSAGYPWGWALLPGAAAVAGFGLWVFTTAAKGWPVTEA